MQLELWLPLLLAVTIYAFYSKGSKSKIVTKLSNRYSTSIVWKVVRNDLIPIMKWEKLSRYCAECVRWALNERTERNVDEN